jgi:hypothetical protein
MMQWFNSSGSRLYGLRIARNHVKRPRPSRGYWTTDMVVVEFMNYESNKEVLKKMDRFDPLAGSVGVRGQFDAIWDPQQMMLTVANPPAHCRGEEEDGIRRTAGAAAVEIIDLMKKHAARSGSG